MSILIIGRKGCGKTTLAVNICPNPSLAVVPFALDGVLYTKRVISTDPQQFLWDTTANETIILDGCMLSSQDWTSAAFRRVFAKKHSIIVTTNYAPNIDMKVFDYVFFFKERNSYIKNEFYIKYASLYISEYEFTKIIESLLPYEFIMFDGKNHKVQVHHTKI